jgi:hypothetical protein
VAAKAHSGARDPTTCWGCGGLTVGLQPFKPRGRLSSARLAGDAVRASSRKGGFPHLTACWPASFCLELLIGLTLLLASRHCTATSATKTLPRVTHACAIRVWLVLYTSYSAGDTMSGSAFGLQPFKINRDGYPAPDWPGSRLVRHATSHAGFKPPRRLSTPHGLPAGCLIQSNRQGGLIGRHGEHHIATSHTIRPIIP